MAEVAEVVAGAAFPKHLQGRPEGRFPVFKVGEISRASQAGQIVLHDSPNNVGPGDLKGKALPKGAVVFAKIGEALKLNRRAILGRAAFVDNNVMGLIPKAGVIDSRYLYYFSLSLDLSPLSQATAVPSIRKSDVLELSVPTPSLSEQELLVEEIEKQFTRLDAAVGALHRTRANLKRYEASLMNMSFNGVWQREAIGDLSERVTVGHVGSMKDEYIEDGIPFLRSQNVRPNRFDPDGLKFIGPSFHKKLSKSELRPGDVVVVRSGDVGQSCVVPETLGVANCADLVIIRQPHRIRPQFLCYFLNSVAKSDIRRGTVGVALRHFNTKSVASMQVPVPDLDDQDEMVNRLDAQMSAIAQAERQVQLDLRRAANLRQAILAKAFRGELVTEARV